MATRQSWTVSPLEADVRLDKFLAFPARLASRSAAVEALDHARVFVNGRSVGADQSGRKLVPGDVVGYWADRPGSAHARTSTTVVRGVRILYEDDALLVVDKPPGLLTVPLGRRKAAPSVATILAERPDWKGRRAPLVVHRIDRDTSGIVVFAKTPPALVHLKAQFESRLPVRIYSAIVTGVPSPASGEWRDSLVWDGDELTQRVVASTDRRARVAICEYQVVESFGRAALLDIRLITGKRNQIRVQANRHGHPLLGERQYRPAEGAAPVANTRPATSSRERDPRVRLPQCPRQALHARHLELAHPLSGQQVVFDAPLPRDLIVVLDALRHGRR